MSRSFISPLTPARVQVLLVPVGKITRNVFDQCVKRLQQESIVRLSDISPDARSDRNMFSPMAFPSGFILYNMTTANLSETATSLAPFDFARDPFIVLGIADGARQGTSQADVLPLNTQMDNIRKGFDNVMMTHILLFETDLVKDLPPAMTPVPPASKSRRTTIKTIMCDISAKFLGELVIYARSIQNARSIDVPEPTEPSNTRFSGFNKSAIESASSGSHGAGENSRPATPGSNLDSGSDRAGTPGLKKLPGDRGSLSSPPYPLSPSRAADDRPVSGRFDSRPTSPESWNAATGAGGRPLSSSELPPHVKAASATERNKNRLRGRQSVAIGTLYLVAGRWTDALKELNDGATRARAFGDHSWHAKGLENLLVAMLLLAWNGTDFVIPSICSSSTDGARPRRSASIAAETQTDRPSSEHSSKNLHLLSVIIPDLLDNICNTLSRPINLNGALMPQLPFSESIIRASYLLTCLRRDGNELSKDSLNAMVDDSVADYLEQKASSPILPTLSRQEISDMLFRAYPTMPPSSSGALYETVLILSGMGTVLSLAKMQRKRSVLAKDMLSIMIPGLIQARKIGAAEVGIHPAASLAALHGLGEDGMSYKSSNTDRLIEAGLRMLMCQLCDAYGVKLDAWTGTDRQESSNDGEVTADYSMALMRYEVLRLCMNFSEAMPNFKDVTYIAATLLELAGPDFLQAPEDGVVKAKLSTDEQARLATKIYRTLGVVKSLDAEKLAPRYWDQFIVRGVELCDPPPAKLLTLRSRSDFEPVSRTNRASSITKQGPFIHDASLAVSQNKKSNRVTAAGQRSEFWVLLQNPYDFEMSIEDIRLVTEGVPFSQRQQVVTLGPARIQRTLVSGTAEEAGKLVIKGVQIHIQGCQLQEFQIFPQAWRRYFEAKVSIGSGDDGRSADKRSDQSQVNDQEAKEESKRPASLPKPSSSLVTVAPPQPLCVLTSHSLSQSIMTVLEGETQSFSLTIRNISDRATVNFAHLSFEHSLRSIVKTEARGIAGQIQAFELKEAALARPPMKWTDLEKPVSIKPGSTSTFNIDVYGLRGMTEGTVHVDYATVDHDSPQSAFYTRRLTLPFAITVGGSLEIQRFDAMTLAKPLADVPGTAEASIILKRFHAVADKTRSFALLLDLWNAWSRPVSAKLVIKDPRRVISDAANRTLSEFEEVVPAGQIKRIAVPVPQVFVADITKAPPSNFADAVQFVVADSEEDRQAQISLLEKFWYKQELLKALSGTWHETNGPRNGYLDFSGIDLTHSVIDRIKKASVHVELQATPQEGDLRKDVNGTTTISTLELAILRAKITNNTQDSLSLAIKLSPSIAWQRTEPWDISRRLCWTGAFERRIAVLRPDEERELSWGLTAASSGEYVLRVEVFAGATSGRASQVPSASSSTNLIVIND